MTLFTQELSVRMTESHEVQQYKQYKRIEVLDRRAFLKNIASCVQTDAVGVLPTAMAHVYCGRFTVNRHPETGLQKPIANDCSVGIARTDTLDSNVQSGRTCGSISLNNTGFKLDELQLGKRIESSQLRQPTCITEARPCVLQP